MTVRDMLRPVVRLGRKALSRRPIRRIMTANYSTGLVALGERNSYRIPRNWITVDWEDADLVVDFVRCDPLPFADESQLVVYSAHTIEHVSQAVLEHLVEESYRILRHGGYLRLEAPDAEQMIVAYKTCDTDFLRRLSFASLIKAGMSKEYAEDHVTLLGFLSSYCTNNAHVPVMAAKGEVDARVANLGVEEFGQWCVSLQTAEQRRTGGHVNPIYYSKLEAVLRKAGFSDVQRMRNRHSRIPGIDIARIERADRAFYSVYVEARK